jgi:predicted carbohydrate-binding protein with CBM5 and CBM33 domain
MKCRFKGIQCLNFQDFLNFNRFASIALTRSRDTKQLEQHTNVSVPTNRTKVHVIYTIYSCFEGTEPPFFNKFYQIFEITEDDEVC